MCTYCTMHYVVLRDLSEISRGRRGGGGGGKVKIFSEAMKIK